MRKCKFLLLFLCAFPMLINAQGNSKAYPTFEGKISSVEYVSPLLSRPGDLIPVEYTVQEAKDKRSLATKMDIGPDPQKVDDYFVTNRHEKEQTAALPAPTVVFDAYSSGSQPTDPSLAIGPNHIMVVFNTGFTIYDKSGNQLLGQTSPNPAIFPSGGCCDLTVSYDNAADRWVLSFLGSGAQIAVSDGPDPLTAGWYIYNISSVSDYQKLSVWSDGYYLTDNTGSNNKVWVLERSAMLNGNPNAQIIGFNLPGIATSGFYSPQAFNVTDNNFPAAGGATIVYMQDDAWGGVSQDHIKLWTIDVNWANTSSSTISSAQEIVITPFIGVFDGGSFSNLAQPGGGSSVDALQATIMNQAQFRKFATHNSALFNFVVDTDGSNGELAGVRWIELRQSGDNQPWSLYQEGTYTAADGKHAWNASLAMDGQGNIGMGYTAMSGPTTPNTVRVSSYYTGRKASDPLGTMTGAEELISAGNQNFSGTRYGDYSKIDVDPSDDQTFWFITEYMNSGRKGVVGSFKVETGPPDTEAPTTPTNLAASNITSSSATLTWTASTDNVAVDRYNIFIDGNQVGTSTNTTFDVTGLSQLTSYTATVNAQDVAGNTSGNATTTFTTLEATASYCASASTNVNDEYISRVQLNTIDNSSGAQFYSDFTSISTDLDEGQSYTITVTPTWTGQIYAEAYAAWIDYNDDKDFEDAGELVWSKAASTDTPNSGTFTVPSGTSLTSVRMRVSMKYNAIPLACETFQYGEVEDYTVNLKPGADPDTEAPTDPTNLTASNITTSSATLTWTASTDNVGVDRYNIFIDGNQVGTSTNTTFDITGLSESTTYTAAVNAQDEAGNTSGNATTSFTTLQVTSSYCASASTNVNDEYISRVQLNGIDNSSGAQFYSDFTSISTDLDEGQSYTITVTPTWTGTVYPEGYAVWIDYNNDQDFADAGELVWSKAASTDTPNSGTFTVPSGTSLASVRMRVSMKYNGVPTSCETFQYGEVEDYTVNLKPGGGTGNPGQIAAYYFETGFDGWSDPGSDCARVLTTTRSYEGEYSIRLRDNTSTSNTESPVLDLSGNTEVTLEFHVFVNSMEPGEDFFVEFYNGSAYEIIGNYASGAALTNETFFDEVITLNAASYNFNANNRIRFRCDASGNGDRLYFDQIIISGDNVSPGTQPATSTKTKYDDSDILKSFTEVTNGNIEIHPNPTNSTINIDILKGDFDEMTIFSSKGKIVYQTKPDRESLSIDVSEFTPGMYFVRFVSNRLAVTKRFVKE